MTDIWLLDLNPEEMDELIREHPGHRWLRSRSIVGSLANGGGVKIAIYCLHIKCSFSTSFSPEYNFNLEQQLTPERSEGVSSCSNLKLYEGLKEGEKEHLYASNT